MDRKRRPFFESGTKAKPSATRRRAARQSGGLRRGASLRVVASTSSSSSLPLYCRADADDGSLPHQSTSNCRDVDRRQRCRPRRRQDRDPSAACDPASAGMRANAIVESAAMPPTSVARERRKPRPLRQSLFDGCLRLARSRHAAMSAVFPLLKEKRTRRR
jgi:hypothetical protein